MSLNSLLAARAIPVARGIIGQILRGGWRALTGRERRDATQRLTRKMRISAEDAPHAQHIISVAEKAVRAGNRLNAGQTTVSRDDVPQEPRVVPTQSRERYDYWGVGIIVDPVTGEEIRVPVNIISDELLSGNDLRDKFREAVRADDFWYRNRLPGDMSKIEIDVIVLSVTRIL